MMSLKSELFNFLLGIPNIQTVKERQALLTAVGFDQLNPRIDWEGSTRVFLNRLLELLCSEGQKELVKFLRNLAIPNLHLVGLENRDKLNEFADKVSSLTSEEWDRKFPKTEEQVKPNPPNNILYHGSKNFVGREEELAQIDQNLKKSGIVAISGMGGVGKTELVTQYARRNESDFPGGICWLRARESVLAEEIILFAQNEMQLQVPQQNFQGKTLSLVEQVDWYWKNWRPSDGLVLVILDDVTDFGNCLEFLPKNNRFRLLITTRLRNLDANIEEIYLDVLIPEQALELFTAIVGVKRVQKELEIAQKLCDELGYLPLGLELLGRYIVKKPPQWTLAKMLERLQRQKIEDEAINPQEEQLIKSLTTAQKGIKAAFELSWRELEPITQRVGELLSLFAPTIFAWEWVETVAKRLNWDSSNVETANDELLYRQNLIQYVDEREGFYQIHPLIREFLKVKFAGLEDKDSLKREFAGIFVSIAQKIPQSPTQDDIKSVQEAIPHLAEIVENLIDAVSDENLIAPFVGLERYYQGQGLYTFAEHWLKQCVSLLKIRLGKEHPHVADSYNNLASVYHSQGRYQEAESFYLKSLELRRKLLGEKHPDLATSYNNLASVYNSQGKYQEAESFLLQSLELRHKLLGEDHPDVASSYNNLASVYHSQGRYQEAESFYLHSLKLRRKLLGEEHLHVASSYNNLASIYGSQGKYQEAESFYLKSLELMRKILGEDNPDVASVYNNLAYLYESQGRYKEAESFYLHSLEIADRTVGSNHPTTNTIRENLKLLRDKLA